MTADLSSLTFDTFTPVRDLHRHTALKALRSLRLFTHARKHFVVADRETLRFLQSRLPPDLPAVYLEEHELVTREDAERLRMVFRERIGSDERARWYFQQFYKMAACRIPEIAEHYLIWDGDAILLRTLDFCDSTGRACFCTRDGYCQAYFDTINRLFGLEKPMKPSFIAEHQWIDTAVMNNLLSELEQAPNRAETWMLTIIGAIADKDLGASGFSEYETYGTYFVHHHPNDFVLHTLKHMRGASALFGSQPDRITLASLMARGYAFASFESYHRLIKTRAPIHRAWALLQHVLAPLTKAGRQRRATAAFICGK